jgi:uncharacterized protein RhaS with RHS repeats
VDFYNGATLIGTATQIPYSINWTSVAAGSYTLTAKAIDNSAATTTSTALHITVINNAAPTVTLSSDPIPPATAVAPATITLTATAADSDGTINKVEFYNGAALLNTATQSPYVYSWTNVAAGTYTVTAKATDNLGTATTSNPLTITVTGAQAQVYYIQTDQLNTPRLITDSANHPVWQLDNSDPFGANLPNEDPAASGAPFKYNPRFPGQYFDKETNLHYN